MVVKSQTVCLVVPSLKAGGMERVMAQMANYFAKDSSIDLHLILLVNSPKFFNIDERVKIHEPVFDANNRFSLLLKTLSYLRNNLKIIKPNVLISFGSMYNSFVLLAAMGLDIRVYVSDRSNPHRNTYLSLKKDQIRRNDGIMHYFLKKILYKKAAGILVQTEIAKKIEYEYSGHDNIILFANPIREIKEYPDLRRKKWIINVGRFIKTKNQILLIKIFSEIKDKDWKLIFAGDGPELGKAKEMVCKLEMNDSIIFLGNVKDLDKYLRQSHIFAFTSTSEGFPNALGEALKASLACISFDCTAGPSDMINNEYNGFLVENLNKEEYKSKLESLMKNEELRVKFQKNALLSMNRYDSDKILENLKREIL